MLSLTCINIDGLEEIKLGKRRLGTTGKGIGPSYSSKASRNGSRASEIFDELHFEQKLRTLAVAFKKLYGDLLIYDVEDEVERFKVCTHDTSIHTV